MIKQITFLVCILAIATLGIAYSRNQQTATEATKPGPVILPSKSKLSIAYQDVDDALFKILDAGDIRRVDKKRVYESQVRFMDDLKRACPADDEECNVAYIDDRISVLNKLRNTLRFK